MRSILHAMRGTRLAVDVYLPDQRKSDERLLALTRYWRASEDPETGKPQRNRAQSAAARRRPCWYPASCERRALAGADGRRFYRWPASGNAHLEVQLSAMRLELPILGQR